jgi:hypothetical protein
MMSCKKLFISTWIFSLTLLMAGGDLYPVSSAQNISVLYPDEYLSSVYSKSKCRDSLQTRKITLWDQPSNFSGARKIGEIAPGTITNIEEKYENFYKITDPMNGTTGWISQKQAVPLSLDSSNESCSDHVEASNKYLRQMDYYMATGDRKNGGLYMAAKKAQRAAIGVIKLCPFSIDLISDYACSLPFYSQVMNDESSKY